MTTTDVRERDRERDRERETDRQTDRQRERESERERFYWWYVTEIKTTYCRQDGFAIISQQSK